MAVLDFNKAEYTASYGLASQLPAAALPEFVFAGRSNVGKSSLINKLCNRKKLARVSGTPGKTATINFYKAGEAFLVDLPGYGYAKTSHAERRRWDGLINGYFGQERQMALMLLLLDSRHDPSKDDVGMLEYLAHNHIDFVAVLTKYDKIKPSKRTNISDGFTEMLKNYNCKGVFLTSSESGEGMEELRHHMQSIAENGGANGL